MSFAKNICFGYVIIISIQECAECRDGPGRTRCALLRGAGGGTSDASDERRRLPARSGSGIIGHAGPADACLRRKYVSIPKRFLRPTGPRDVGTAPVGRDAPFLQREGRREEGGGRRERPRPPTGDPSDRKSTPSPAPDARSAPRGDSFRVRNENSSRPDASSARATPAGCPRLATGRCARFSRRPRAFPSPASPVRPPPAAARRDPPAPRVLRPERPTPRDRTRRRPSAPAS